VLEQRQLDGENVVAVLAPELVSPGRLQNRNLFRSFRFRVIFESGKKWHVRALSAVPNGTAHLKKCKQLFVYQHLLLLRDISGLYYKPMMIVNDNSRVVNKLEASLTEGDRVVIYDRHMFIVQATGGQSSNPYLNVVHFFNTSVY
jgi:hypothetical protein